MRKVLMGAALGMALAAVAACSTVGNVVSTVGGAVYADASSAVGTYCQMSPAQRAVAQLVVAGKVYNTGLCDVVNGDTTLDVQLAQVTQEKAAEVIDAAIAKAVSEGRLTQEQADVIQALRAGTPAVEPTTPAADAATTASTGPTVGGVAIGAEESPVPTTVAEAIQATARA